MIVGLQLTNKDIHQVMHSTLSKIGHTVLLLASSEEVHKKNMDICIIESDNPFKCETPIVWITDLETPWFVTRKFPFSVHDFCESLECGRMDIDSKYVGVHVDPTFRRVFVDGEEIRLTKNEYGVLSYLKSCDGNIVSRITLIEEVWGMDTASGPRAVDVVVTRLRNKLGPNRAGHIHSISGEGYSWRAKL